jgi:monofunctional biosynthetic peptidoglycan transglycosylase
MAMDPVGARQRQNLVDEVFRMTRALVLSALIALMGVPSMAQAPQAPLFAFTSSDSAATWQAVNDGVMGGVSDGRFRITQRQTLEFYGTLSLENNGGFASVRSRPRTLGLQTGDTLVARVRGDGREYQLNLYTSERMRAFSYRAPLKTRAGEWIEVAIALDRFEATSFGRVLRGAGPVDPRSVTSIGFLLAEKTPGPFALEVAWINVLRGPGR